MQVSYIFMLLESFALYIYFFNKIVSTLLLYLRDYSTSLTSFFTFYLIFCL
jgi:hypothetical protein